ncbi:MAG: hypothetical protein RLZZ417_2679 [Bacteroidota bacterium]|jgi:hypothetical protein
METLLENNLIDLGFSPSSKIWIYTSDKVFNEGDELMIQHNINEFCENWDSHGVRLKANGFILYSRIIVLVVDESFYSVSGCSMDNSVAFIKNLENKFNVSLFNRLLQTAYYNGEWKTFPTAIWSEKLKANEITLNTLFIDTLVNNLQDLQNHLIKKLGDFWLKRII